MNHGGREILLCERLRGNHVVYPTTATLCGDRALLGADAFDPQTNSHGYSIRTKTRLDYRESLQNVQGVLSNEESRTLRRTVGLVSSLLERIEIRGIPTGIIHGDMFRDNVLFNEHGLCGVLDFHHAGYGFWLFDLAIAINDWCVDNGSLDREKTLTMLREYNSIRKIENAEYWGFPHFLLYAACLLLVIEACGYCSR